MWQSKCRQVWAYERVSSLTVSDLSLGSEPSARSDTVSPSPVCLSILLCGITRF